MRSSTVPTSIDNGTGLGLLQLQFLTLLLIPAEVCSHSAWCTQKYQRSFSGLRRTFLLQFILSKSKKQLPNCSITSHITHEVFVWFVVLSLIPLLCPVGMAIDQYRHIMIHVFLADAPTSINGNLGSLPGLSKWPI